MNTRSIDPDDPQDEKRDSTPASDNAIPDPHADKYNDPRVRVTRRGIWIGVVVTLLGIVGAAVSIYARRTRLEQTTKFWGTETITALQLGERVKLMPVGSDDFTATELTAMPGLGLLRHVLLDEQSFDWSTACARPANEFCSQHSDDALACVRLELTDPTAKRVDRVTIDIDLIEGWVGPADGSRRVQTTPRMKSKLHNFFKTIVDVQRLRYDLRDPKS